MRQSVPLTGVSGLPVAPRALLGRAREVAQARGLLLDHDVRLLTLTGPGGVGKTRLALDVAGGLLDEFPAGVYFVDLAPLRDATLVMPAVADALGARLEAGRDLLGGLRQLAGTARLLVVLDNCEHVLTGMPSIGELLGVSPGLKVLATSRQPLGLLWEHVYPVGPLALPDLERDKTADVVGLAPAAALFVHRARASAPGFELTDASAAAVASICARLDGLPLALELAAARVRLLPPDALLTRLESSLDVLRAPERDRPERHQTLRATLDWSYELLTEVEQRVLTRLSVFAGGWTLEAAEALGADLDTVASLADKGLVQREDDVRGFDVRFRLLETVREYAHERLQSEPGAAAAAGAAHARYFLALAERAESLVTGFEESGGLALVDREWDNLQAALGWSIDAADGSLSLRLAAALSAFGSRRHEHVSARAGDWPLRALLWLERVLARDVGVPGPDRLKVLGSFATLKADAGDRAGAVAVLDEAVALADALGDARTRTLALATSTWIDWQAGNHSRVPALLERLAECEEAPLNQWSLGWFEVCLGRLVHSSGDAASARSLSQRALSRFRECGEAQGTALALAGLAEMACEEGAVHEAATMAAEALTVLRGAVDSRPLANVAEVAVIVDGALSAGAGDEPLSDSKRRLRVLGAIDAMRAVSRVRRAPQQQVNYDQVITDLRTRLDSTAFERVWAEGHELTPEAALNDALVMVQRHPAPPPQDVADRSAKVSTWPLTPREAEVATLIAHGQTSKEIADTLVITERTADTHASHIREKLGLGSRAEIAAWAVRHGLVAEEETPAR